MKAVVYARVSVHGEDIGNQIEAIKEWAREHNYEIVGVFRDEAVTGAGDPLEREAFKSLMKYCEDNNVKTMLVYDLSRFGRSLPEAVQALKKLLNMGYMVIFTRFNLKADLNDVAGKVMIYTLLMASELERDFMRMRLETAKKAGKRIGRPPKIDDNSLKKYLEKYRQLKLKDVWKIMKSDGYDISYFQFLRRVKKLMQKR